MCGAFSKYLERAWLREGFIKMKERYLEKKIGDQVKQKNIKKISEM
jgi:hypothetical protein